MIIHFMCFSFLSISLNPNRANWWFVETFSIFWCTLHCSNSTEGIMEWFLWWCLLVWSFQVLHLPFSLGIPASDGESLAPASDDVRLDGLCSWKLCTTGIWYMTHQTPPPNNLKIKLKLSKIRKKSKKSW